MQSVLNDLIFHFSSLSCRGPKVYKMFLFSIQEMHSQLFLTLIVLELWKKILFIYHDFYCSFLLIQNIKINEGISRVPPMSFIWCLVLFTYFFGAIVVVEPWWAKTLKTLPRHSNIWKVFYIVQTEIIWRHVMKDKFELQIISIFTKYIIFSAPSPPSPPSWQWKQKMFNIWVSTFWCDQRKFRFYFLNTKLCVFLHKIKTHFRPFSCVFSISPNSWDIELKEKYLNVFNQVIFIWRGSRQPETVHNLIILYSQKMFSSLWNYKECWVSSSTLTDSSLHPNLNLPDFQTQLDSRIRFTGILPLSDLFNLKSAMAALRNFLIFTWHY